MALDLETRHALLAGRASYRDLAHGRVPWLDSPLVATDEARQRLLEWAEGGGLDRAPFTREEIRTRLDACHFGDDELGALALDVLGRIAPPARDYVLTHTWVLTVGRRTSGWTNPAPAPPAGEHHLVVVHGRDRTDDEIRSTLGHEFAHVWLLPARRPDSTVASRLRASWPRMAAEGRLDAFVDAVVDIQKRNEAEADALAEAWGFPRPWAQRRERLEGARADWRAQAQMAAEHERRRNR